MDHSTESSVAPSVNLGLPHSVNWPLYEAETEMPIPRDSNHDIREDIGEIRGTLGAMQDFLRENRESLLQGRRELEERLSADILRSREEVRSFNTQAGLQLEKVSNQARALEAKTADISSELSKVKSDVTEVTKAQAALQADVASLKSLKDNVVKHVMIIVSIITVLWAIVAPLVQGWLKGLVFGGGK